MKQLKAIAAIAAIAALLTMCTQEEDAKRVLSQHGYTEIEMTGCRPFMKSKDDTFSTGFKARSPNGSTVTGSVTGGPLKGNTIRLD